MRYLHKERDTLAKSALVPIVPMVIGLMYLSNTAANSEQGFDYFKVLTAARERMREEKRS
jgi:hypothetical protein